MSTLRRTTSTLLAAAALVVLPTLPSAHEVTHNGTVVALKTAKYAQPSGGTREVRELEVAVVDPRTKKVANRVFTITDKTKITRAGKPVTTADLTADTDEKVAVVVDHDKPGDEAIHVRFEAANDGPFAGVFPAQAVCSSGQRLSVASSVSRRLAGRGSSASAYARRATQRTRRDVAAEISPARLRHAAPMLRWQ
jgi:hypothetical protein